MRKPDFKIAAGLCVLVLLNGCTPFYEATKGWGKRFYNRIDAAATKAQAQKTPLPQAPKATTEVTGVTGKMEATDQGDILSLTCCRQSAGIPLPPAPHSRPATRVKAITTTKKATPEKPDARGTAALSLLPEEKKIPSRLSQTPAPQKATPTEKAGYGLHLASYKKKARAEKGWVSLKKTFASELKGLNPDYPQITLPDKSTFHRVVAGFFSSKARAQQQCKALKAKYQYCAVTKNRTR